MKVVLHNHHEYQSIVEILRMFFLAVGKPEEKMLELVDLNLDLANKLQETVVEISIEDAAYNNIILYSSLSAQVSKEQMRDQGDQTRILVKTWIKDSELLTIGTDKMIEASIKPSAIRREIKRQAYYVLSHLTGINYPWGSLSGVRPTQIVYRSYLENNQDFALAKSDLVGNWYLTAEKAEIGLETAIAEDRILSGLNQHLPMLYIGVPFCTTRCAYCSFITQDAIGKSTYLENYTNALIIEIREISNFFRNKGEPFQAIYMGGGTPTALPDDCFERVMREISEQIPRVENCEITIEAGRPDSITEKKLLAIKSIHGKVLDSADSRKANLGDDLDCEYANHFVSDSINISSIDRIENQPEIRICINPQTMHDQTLQIIGRDHSVADVYQAFKQARDHNFVQINMDLILGLPGETANDFLDSLDKILKLEPESITVHTMALKRSAFLQQNFADRYLQQRFPDSELSNAFSSAIRNLIAKGYKPYYLYRQKNVRGGLENIGFAKPGHACGYNVGMMSDRISVVGLGSGSSSKRVEGDRVERIYNPKDLTSYIQRITEIIQRKKDFFK